ncbi:hypothetical protein FRB95_001210 [Tulasnella sp. JGI-2019a]|nr:hypothetical protein FRB95_001210 [Tulasnella sp. JGI-2019a]
MASAGQSPNHCTPCKKNFESPRGLIDHKIASKHHFYCVRCNLDFNTANELAQHLEKSLPVLGNTDAPFCAPCFKRFKDFEHLREHLTTTKRHEASCKECILDFHDASALQKHQDMIHAVVPPVEETPVPNVINQETDTAGAGPSTTRCTLCKKNFETPRGLIHHKTLSKYHFFCARCNLDFATETELAQHLEKPLPVRGDTDALFCVPCSKRFKDLEHLRKHLATTKRHEASCEECVVDFHDVNALQKHQDAAHAAIPLVEETTEPKDVIAQGPDGAGAGPSTNRCTLCKKDFESPRGLADHKIRSKYHFFCGRCNLDFATSSEHSQHLDESLPILGDMDAISCVPCSQPFKDLEGLRKHLTTKRHETSCIDCMIDFHHMHALQKHRNIVHAVIPPAPPVEEISVPEDTNIQEPDMAGAEPPTNRCTLCKKNFDSPRRLVGHKIASKHHFFCGRCNLDFATASEHSQHLDKSLPILGDTDAILCVLCSQHFKDLEGLREHLTAKKHEASCIDCIVDFHNVRALQKHRDDVHAVVSPLEETPESDDDEIQGPDSVQPPSSPFFCRRCRVSHQTVAERKDHLDTALPLFDGSSITGTVVCIPCKTTYSTFQAFVDHVDASYQARTRHRNACTDCLVDFHNFIARQKHRRSNEHGVMQGRRTGVTVSPTAKAPALAAPAPVLPSKPMLNTPQSSSTARVVSGSPKGQAPELVAPMPAPPSVHPSLMLRASQPSTSLPVQTERNFSGTPTAPVSSPPPGPKVMSVAPPAPGSVPRVFQPSLLSRIGQKVSRAPTTMASPPQAAAVPPPPPSPPTTAPVAAPASLPASSPILQAPRPSLPMQMGRNVSRTPTVPASASASVPSRPRMETPPIAAPAPAPSSVLPAYQPSTLIPPNYCRRCHARFHTEQELIEHVAKPISLLSMETDGTDRPRCNKCQRPFSNLQAMRLHLTCGIEAHENSCADCLLDFHTAEGLQKHKDRVHSMPALPAENFGSVPSESGLPTARRPPSPITTSRPIRNNQASTPSNRLVGRRTNNNESSGEPNPWGLRQVVSVSGVENAVVNAPQTSGSRSSMDNRPLHAPMTGRQGTAVPLRGIGHGAALASPSQERAGLSNPAVVAANPIAPSSASRKAKQKAAVPPREMSSSHEKAISVPCPLCLDTATDLTAAPCGHAGCLACLTQSVRIKPECPVCRTPLTLGQLHPLFL